MTEQQHDRPPTTEEQLKQLFDRTAKLNDAVSALLAPAWGSEIGIIPSDHPLYVGEQLAGTAATDLRDQVRAAIESEIYEYRERTMLWEETGGITQEIARLASRGAMEIVQPILDRFKQQNSDLARAYLGFPAPEPTEEPGDSGPSVREAAANDRAWDLQKHGE